MCIKSYDIIMNNQTKLKREERKRSNTRHIRKVKNNINFFTKITCWRDKLRGMKMLIENLIF